MYFDKLNNRSSVKLSLFIEQMTGPFIVFSQNQKMLFFTKLEG